MSIDLSDLDEVVAWGNPWHGALRGSVLTTASAIEVAAVAVATPDTHLVEFPGLPEVTTPEDLAALGGAWKNYALLLGIDRRYSAKSNTAFGQMKHVYLTEDRTHYHIEAFSEGVTASLAVGAAITLSVELRAKKAIDGHLAPAVVLLDLDFAATAIGPGAGYYSLRSTFSPDGQKVALIAHKWSSSDHATARDVRRSAGCVGIWEVVLSGGSASAAPTAEITQIKTSAACRSESQTAGSTVSEFGYIELVGSSSSVSGYDENGVLLPDPQRHLFGYFEHVVHFQSRGLGGLKTILAILGAAYDASNTLQIFSTEAASTESYSSSYSGPPEGPMGRITYDAIVIDGSYGLVRWIDRPADRSLNFDYTHTVTTTFKIKAGATEVLGCTLVKTTTRSWSAEWVADRGGVVGFDGVSAGSLLDSSAWTDNGASITGGYLSPTDARSAILTSNNTAALIKSDSPTAAYVYVAPSGSVGGARTFALDSQGLPWAAWNPKTNALTTVPGESWC